MISLQFSIINIFLSFRGYTQFHFNSSEIWEGKKERKRERVWFERLESHKFIGIFDMTLTGFSVGIVFWRIWEMKFENLFILDSFTPCSTERTCWECAVTFGCRSWCDCQNCKMRERWKIESVSEWIRECVLEEEWMTDISISYGMWNCWIFNRSRYVSAFIINFSFGWIWNLNFLLYFCL